MNAKRALVTGASCGIGHVFSKQLAKENFLITCVARSEEKLQHVVQELGEGHKYMVADLTDPAQLAHVEQELDNTK